MKTSKKKPVKAAKAAKAEDRREEFPSRLSELEADLRNYPTRPEGNPTLSSVKDAEEAVINKETVVQFLYKDKTYATGHSDLTYAESNHARGIRHISFYAEGKIVLYIEGDFEDQQFGSNFQFHTLEIYTPGPWEDDFIALSNELRNQIAKRREAFRMKRSREKGRDGRDLSRY